MALWQHHFDLKQRIRLPDQDNIKLSFCSL